MIGKALRRKSSGHVTVKDEVWNRSGTAIYASIGDSLFGNMVLITT